MEGARLRLSRYSKAYRQRLVEGATHLGQFCEKKDVSFGRLLKGDGQEVDLLLENFVNDLYDQRATRRSSLRIAKHGVLYIQVIRPRLRHQLKSTWATIKAWEEQQPSQLRSPLPIVLLVSMICKARLLSEVTSDSKTRRRWLVFSSLIGLGFFGMLRPGEIFNLRCGDIGIPNQLSFGAPCITIRISKPKNFRQLGHSQFVVVSQPDICNWVTWICSVSKNSDERLWDASPTEFRRMFKVCIEKLLRTKSRFSPASLRAGGATFHFDGCQDVGRLRLSGRWSNSQSLEHYIQVAKAQQLAVAVTDKASRKIKSLIKKGFFLLALPARFLVSLDPTSVLPHGLGAFEDSSILWRCCRDWGRSGEKI